MEQKKYWQDERYKVTVGATIVWGLLAHGVALVSDFNLNDNTYNFGLGWGVEVGRWMLTLFKMVSEPLLGQYLYSVPLLLGALSIVVIAISNCFIVSLLNIKNKLSCIALSGVMVAFPAITSLFGYMFTSVAYMLGFLFAAIGTYCVCKDTRWYLYLLGIILLACSVGVYQAYIPVTITLMLFYMIKSCVDGDFDNNLPKLITKCIKILTACASYMLLYFAVLKLLLKVLNKSLFDYGLGEATGTGIADYIRRIPIAYSEFFSPTKNVTYNMYPMSIQFWYYLLITVLGVLCIVLFLKLFKRNKLSALLLAILLLLLPLAVNFIYIMCGAESVNIHSLMMYGEALIFVFVIWISENTTFEAGIVERYIRKAGIILVLLIAFLYVHFANICYLKADYLQKAAISYYTTLSTRIQSIDGYKVDMPVVYINEYNKKYNHYYLYYEFSEVNIIPYSSSSLLNNYAWRDFMKTKCGFAPLIVEPTVFEEGHPIISQMPAYPNDGSIQIIDGMIVVKF